MTKKLQDAIAELGPIGYWPLNENHDNHILELARTAGCTNRQLQALELKARGYGKTRIARILDISPQAVDARLTGAYRRIRNA